MLFKDNTADTDAKTAEVEDRQHRDIEDELMLDLVSLYYCRVVTNCQDKLAMSRPKQHYINYVHTIITFERRSFLF